MSERDEARSALLGAARKRTCKVVEVDGRQVEVRKPTVKTRGEIVAAGKPDAKGVPSDFSAFQVEAVVKCCYVPGTDERLFNRADAELLLDTECDGMVDELSAAAIGLMGVDAEALKKTSATPPSDNSSS